MNWSIHLNRTLRQLTRLTRNLQDKNARLTLGIILAMSLSCPILFCFFLIYISLCLVSFEGQSQPIWWKERPKLAFVTFSKVSAFQSWGQTLARFGRTNTYPCGQKAGSEKMRGNFVGELKKQQLSLANIENYLKMELYLI